MKPISINSWEGNAVARAYNMLAQEAGHVTAMCAIYDQVVNHSEKGDVRPFLEMNWRTLPLLSSMVDTDGSNRIRKRIKHVCNQLLPILENKRDIICIGTETAWLDVVTTQQEHKDKIFHIVPHSSDADLNRILANYGENVHIQNSFDLSHLYGSTSVIITFAFGISDYTFYTYPVVHRVCGRDTRQAFSDLIALDIIDSPLRFYPADLVEIDVDEMTLVLSRDYESNKRIRKWKLAAF